LLEKLAKLNLPDEAYNWLKDFFDGHSRCTQFARDISNITGILASVIQGSAIGPVSYVVNDSDQRTMNPDNKIFKFADDIYLLVPSANSHTCESEIEQLNGWAVTNNLGLNQSKSMEMAITAPGMCGAKARIHPPSLVHAIERVSSLRC
jgi:Reverse transcriptase (RNA-dependent DNA polymerase)